MKRGVEFYRLLGSYVQSKAQKVPQIAVSRSLELLFRLYELLVSSGERFSNSWMEDMIQQLDQQDDQT